MKKPSMIIFDYGQTLADEPDFAPGRGLNVLYGHIKSNPDNVSPEQFVETDRSIFSMQNAARKAGCEPHFHTELRSLLDYFGLELDISLEDAERIVWDNTSVGKIKLHADELLRYLEQSGIRYGIISNLGWSGKALTDRMNRLFPQNKFEFIIATSEYGIGKPNKLLFDIALRKAGLPASEVWYCGDSIAKDVMGAAAAGMTPVLYEDNTTVSPWEGQNDELYGSCEYLHFHDWRELIEVLKSYD